MYTNLIVPRRWSRLACACRSVSSVEGRKLPQASPSLPGDGLSPPPRVRRGPTDLLQALAATVGPDPTAAHYKYHDDPYLIPLSNYRKRAYALAAEAGRKAAAWVRDEHAPLFTLRTWDPPTSLKTPHYNAEPHIDAFAPKPIYTDESKVTQEDLRYTIENALVEDAVKVFQLLGGVEGVEAGLQLELLQLVCFYNERPADDPHWLEERWFSHAARERQAATWRLGGLADKIFSSMEPKTPQAYCAIIQGMAKYYQAERAHALAAEALERGVRLSTRVYNALIGCVGFLREGTAQRIDALNSLLADMRTQDLSPDAGTLSACVRSLSLWGGGRNLQNAALQLLAEFSTLQPPVQPTLAVYYHLLCLFCKERGPRVDILSSILSDLESRPRLMPTDPADTSFFVTAMAVCSDHLQDMNMAERVHALLMKDDNYRLVGDAYKESIYYRHYVTVACKHAPLEKTLELLDTLVPHVYVPEPSVMELIIVTLEGAGAGERLAAAWAQLVVFGLARRARLVQRLLAAMHSCYAYQEEEVKAKMREAAADVLTFGQEQDQQAQKRDLRTPNTLTLSADALATIAVLCSDPGAGGATAGATNAAPAEGAGAADGASLPHWEAVSEALTRLQRGAGAGVPADPQALADLATRAAHAGKHGIAAMAVSYLAACGFPEASEAAVACLAAILNRPPAELQPLLDTAAPLTSAPPPALSTAPSALRDALSPAALALLDTYHLMKSGGGGGVVPGEAGRGSSSSSDSDFGSSSSSSDEEE